MSGSWWRSSPSPSASPPPRARPQSQPRRRSRDRPWRRSLATGPVGTPSPRRVDALHRRAAVRGRLAAGARTRAAVATRDNRRVPPMPGTKTPVADSGAVTVTPHMGNTCLKPGSGDYAEGGPYQVMTKTNVDLATHREPAGCRAHDIHDLLSPTFRDELSSPGRRLGQRNWGDRDRGVRVLQQEGGELGASSSSRRTTRTSEAASTTRRPSTTWPSRTPIPAASSTRSSARESGRRGTRRAGSARRRARTSSGATAKPRSAWRAAAFRRRRTRSSASRAAPTWPSKVARPLTTRRREGLSRRLGRRGPHHDRDARRLFAGQPGTFQMMRLYAAWFRCFLADDQVACKLFEGGAPANCGICKDPGWHVLSSKNL